MPIRRLVQLAMATDDPTGTDWTEREIDLVVADYFEMLEMELAGEPYTKAHRNAALQSLTGRSKGSIEYKHQNISAVLLRLGLPWIHGYKPMANFQQALIDGIERLLEARGTTLPGDEAEPSKAGLAEEPVLMLEEPPTLVASSPSDPPALRRLVGKFDPAARDARNRALGRRGEELVFRTEDARLRATGRSDLARKIRWVSEEDGDGAGYDILSFDPNGAERLIEVKTTHGHRTTPFFLTENERAVSEERAVSFRLVRLYEFSRAPRAFELVPPLERWVSLTPANFRASFTN